MDSIIFLVFSLFTCEQFNIQLIWCGVTVIVEIVFVSICFVLLWLEPHPVVSLTNFRICGMYCVMLCYVTLQYVMPYHAALCYLSIIGDNWTSFSISYISFVPMSFHNTILLLFVLKWDTPHGLSPSQTVW